MKGLHPYNIVDLNGHLFVAYAEFDPAGDGGNGGSRRPGLGHLVEYAEDGSLVRDFKDKGKLNAPWGVAHRAGGFREIRRSSAGGEFRRRQDFGLQSRHGPVHR